jgi:hypothetical protein
MIPPDRYAGEAHDVSRAGTSGKRAIPKLQEMIVPRVWCDPGTSCSVKICCLYKHDRSEIILENISV